MMGLEMRRLATKWSPVLAVAVAFTTTSPTSSASTDEPAADPAKDAKLTSAMRGNFEALLGLQPYIADPHAFSDPKNADTIEGYLKSFTALDHSAPDKMKGQEPGFATVASLFADYLKEIRSTFNSGSKEFARNRLRTMTGFCLACHTRMSTSKEFEDVQKKVEQSKLTPFQKAEFLAATRQFDKALDAFDHILKTTEPAEPGLIDFSRAVRQTLSITVRVKKDPKKTYYFLERLSARTDLPEFFRHELKRWKDDAKFWMGEKKDRPNMSDAQLIAKARKLVDRASRLQLFQADHSGDISFLRATNYIHEALARNPQGKQRGEALYLLGVAYEALQDPLLWALDELYFEACVREFPHTEVSKRCYRRYASKIYFGYSGSGGTFVPDYERKKLTELRKLAE